MFGPGRGGYRELFFAGLAASRSADFSMFTFRLRKSARVGSKNIRGIGPLFTALVGSGVILLLLGLGKPPPGLSFSIF